LKPALYTGGFALAVFLLLFIPVWCRNKTSLEFNGVSLDTRENMRTFIYAILEDNDHQERENGFTNEDLTEIYE